MGIKFNCPNGHKLNVKSFLAGRRGICPECDARFRIPMESGGVAELVQKGDRSGEETQLTGAMQDEAGEAMGNYPSAASYGQDFGSPLGTIVNTTPWAANTAAANPMIPASGSRTASPMGSYPTAAGDPLAEDPQAVWYVRPRSGGQYGPAVGEILRDWLREGRVAGDSYVWREGWTDWRPASSVFPQLAGLLTGGAPGAMAAPVGAGVPVAGSLAVVGGLSMGNVPATAGAFPVAGAIASGGAVAGLGALPASGMAALESSASAPRSVPVNRRVDARRRNGNLTALIVILLIVVAIVLVGVFAWVLFGKPAASTAQLSPAISAPADSSASTI